LQLLEPRLFQNPDYRFLFRRGALLSKPVERFTLFIRSLVSLPYDPTNSDTVHDSPQDAEGEWQPTGCNEQNDDDNTEYYDGRTKDEQQKFP
jgi:hypothetical protein